MPDTEAGPEADGGRATRRFWFVAVLTGVLVSQLLRVRQERHTDMWLHIRIGDELRRGVEFGAVPDPLVALADRGYVPTQWLSEVAFSWLHDQFGVPGVLALRLAALLALMCLVYAAARAVAPAPRAAVAGLACLLATSGSWGERPALLGIALQAATVLLWTRARRDGATPWMYVPVMWLWACLHGSWVVGLATGMLMTLVVAADGRVARPGLTRLGLVNGLAAVAVACTPIGPRLWMEPFAVHQHARPAVSEWQQPTATNPLLLILLLVAACIVVAGVRSGRREIRFGDTAIAIAGVALACYSMRTIAFGAVLVAPALARALTALSRRPLGPVALRTERGAGLAALLLVAVLPGALLGVDKGPPVGVAVDSALAGLSPATRVVVEPRLSGWVLQAHPRLVPLRDLRAEIYSPPTVRRHEELLRGGPGWREELVRLGVGAVLVDRTQPLRVRLAQDPAWHYSAGDGKTELWFKKGQ